MSDDVRDIRPYTRHTDETRELAYQLWAFTLGGNCVRVAAALAKMSPPIDVDVRAVQRWAESEHWAIRRADDWTQIAPDLARQTAIEARYGLLESATMARDMVTNDRMRTITTISPTGSVTTKEVPEVSAKDRLTAGLLLDKIASSFPASTDGMLPSHTSSSSSHSDIPSESPTQSGSPDPPTSHVRSRLIAAERERRRRRQRQD
jgi:hypothetical protein